MFLQLIQTALQDSLRLIGGSLGLLLPKFFGGLFFIVFGMVFGGAVGRVVTQILRSVGLNTVLQKVGFSSGLHRFGYQGDASSLFGIFAFGVTNVVFLVAGLQVLGLTKVTEFLQGVIEVYVPQIVSAVVIVTLALWIGKIFARIVSGLCGFLGSKVSRIMGQFAEGVLVIFAGLFALTEVGFGQAYVSVVFTGVVALISLAGGLALGLGGKDWVAKWLQGSLPSQSEREHHPGKRHHTQRGV